MRPKNLSGDGTDADCGTYETSREMKCGSVVADEMASVAAGSGVSGDCANALVTKPNEKIQSSANRNISALGTQSRRECSMHQPICWLWQAWRGASSLTA